MTRVGVLVAAVAALALTAAPAHALTTLAPGQLELSTVYAGKFVAAFQSGVPLDVEVHYRPRRAGASVSAALRVTRAGATCARRPTAGDRRATRVFDGAPGLKTFARPRQTFPAGTSRVCVWIDEGRGFGRPRHLQASFVPSLWATGVIATGATPSDPGSANWLFEAAGTSPVTVTSSLQRRSGAGCETETRTRTSDQGPPYSTPFAEYSGSTFTTSCTGRRFTTAGVQGQSSDYAFDIAPTWPVAVLGHHGDCLPDLLDSAALPPAHVRAFLHGLGCRVGRAYNREDEQRRRAGVPPGGVSGVTYRGRTVTVAPPGTPIDVAFDLPAGAPVPDIGPPEGASPVPTTSLPADPAPQPGGKYDGPPKPAAGCASEVKTGPIVALASCWRRSGEESVSKGRVRLNGIDLTPASGGAEVRINRRTFRVRSRGRVEVRVGTLSLLRDDLDWARPDQVFEIEGEGRAAKDKPKFTVRGQRIFALPVSGSAKLRLEDGRTKLTVTVAIPDEPALRPLQRFAGAAGEITAAADNQAGLVLDGAKLELQGFNVGFMEVQDASVAITQPTAGIFHFDGGATVYPFRFSRTGFAGEFGFGPQDGYFKAGLAAENLNRSIAYGFFLQKIGAGFQLNPFGLSGSAGVTFGPQFRLDRKLLSAGRLDGSVSYLSANGGDPAALELGGALSIAEAQAADGKVKLAGGTVTAEGTADLTVGGYGVKGRMSGWFEGARAFNMEGAVDVSIPGPDGGGDAVLSSEGAGACRRGFGPDVGFGYRWGGGLGGLTVVARSCDLGPWRASKSSAGARAAQAGALRVRRGTRQLAVQVTGAGGAPRVVFTAPGGRQITAGAGPDASFVDATTYYAEDPVTSATYLVVDAPAPGTWQVTPAGGAAVTGVRTAAPLPRVRVTARVRGRGAARRLVYRARGLAGRRVTFVESLGARRKVLGSTSRSRGTLRFRPGTGAGLRTIRAIVTDAGIPSGRSSAVVRYRATSRPATPRRVRIRRTATSRTISWRGSRTLRYEVQVRLSDGRRIRRIARPGTRSVTVRTVARKTRIRVIVRARDGRGIASRGVSRRG